MVAAGTEIPRIFEMPLGVRNQSTLGEFAHLNYPGTMGE